jgi:hypothetical protein
MKNVGKGSFVSLAVLGALWLLQACSVSDSGLAPASDVNGTTSVTSEVVLCPAGLTDKAAWPSNTSALACSKTCGPDAIGVKTCSQSELATCQASSGCVCLSTPCTTCATCAFLTLPACYIPTNPSTAPACADSVIRGGSCAPACGKTLCIQSDGKTGCVCNAQGKYACSTWSAGAWK